MKKIDEYRELLDGFIVSTVPADNGDLEAFCPAHENPGTSKAPSARINFRPLNTALYPNGMISCFVCNFEGKSASLDNIVKLYKQRLESGVKFDKVNRETRVAKFTSVKHPLPDTDTIKDYQDALFAFPEALELLKSKRGLTEETIRKFKIGWMGAKKAYCYPVYDANGDYYAVRLYRIDPNAKVRHTWYDTETEHIPQLFGTQGMEDEPSIILLEGEWDVMLAQQDGFKAISHNGGAGKFKREWADFFRDKVVYIAYDADLAGRKGRILVSKMLKSITKALYFLDFPGPKGTDYTDYRIRDKFSPQDFSDLMMAVRTSGPETETVSTGLPMTGKPVSIAESISSKHIGVPLELQVQVIGKMETYSIPSRIAAECTMDKGKVCESCPMNKGFGEVLIEKNSDFIQRTLDVSQTELERMMLRELGAKCKDKIISLGATSGWTIEPIIVGESVEQAGSAVDSHSLSSTNMNMTVFNVDASDSQVNDIYRVVGHNIPNPRNQKSMFVSWLREPTKTNIDQFAMTPEIYDDLTIFHPRGKQTAYEKLYAIADDLSTNVARITGRAELTMALDISWHSVLSFYFNNNLERRGWVELIVLGDTRTGKSETAHKLAAHYKNGKVFSTEGATRAGIVAAATQPISGSKSWVVTWGIIPQNDRRLLVLDEAQNLQDIIKEMGSIRSKGVADKVTAGITQSTHARTRLIWLANPVKNSKIHQLSDGAVTGIQDFMPAAEDRSRFDMGIAVSSEDVTSEAIRENAMSKSHRTQYSSEACEALVLWAWSRQPEQIKISREVEKHILKVAGDLINEYGGKFELVQKENMHVKLARITVAIAARLFSTDETGELIVVKQEHADAAKQFLNTAYNDKRFGLGRVARREKRDAKQATANLPEIRQWFETGAATGMQNFGQEVYRGLVRAGGRFSLNDFGNLSGLEQGTAQSMISVLVDRKLLSMERNARDVVLTPGLHELITELSDNEYDD